MLSSLLKTVVLVLMTASGYEEKQPKTENENSVWIEEPAHCVTEQEPEYYFNIEAGDRAIECLGRAREISINRRKIRGNFAEWRLLIYSSKKEIEEKETPVVITELLNSFERFVNELTLKNCSTKEFFLNDLPTFAVYISLIQVALQAPPNEIYFSSKREGKLFSSYYFEAAERFHEIKNKAFIFFENEEILKEGCDYSFGNNSSGTLIIKTKIESSEEIKIDEDLINLLEKHSENDGNWREWMRIFITNRFDLQYLKSKKNKFFSEFVNDIKLTTINLESEDSGFDIFWQKKGNIYFVAPINFSIFYSYSSFDQVLTPPMFLSNGEGRILILNNLVEKRTGFLFEMEFELYSKEEKEKFYVLSTKIICYDGTALHLGREFEIIIKFELNPRINRWEISTNASFPRRNTGTKSRAKSIFYDLYSNEYNLESPYIYFRTVLNECLDKGLKELGIRDSEKENFKINLRPHLFSYLATYLEAKKETKQLFNFFSSPTNSTDSIPSTSTQSYCIDNLLESSPTDSINSLFSTSSDSSLEGCSNSLPSTLASSFHTSEESLFSIEEDLLSTKEDPTIVQERMFHQKTIALAMKLEKEANWKNRKIETEEKGGRLVRWKTDKETLNEICKRKLEQRDVEFLKNFLNKYDETYDKENIHINGGHAHWTNRRDRRGETRLPITISNHGQSTIDPKILKDLLNACKDVVKDWGDEAPPRKN